MREVNRFKLLEDGTEGLPGGVADGGIGFPRAHGDVAKDVGLRRAANCAQGGGGFQLSLTDTSLAHVLSATTRGGAALLVRLGGNDEAVRAQRDQMRALGEPREIDADVWRRFRSVEAPGMAVLRLSRLPSRFAATWLDAKRIVEQWGGGYCHGDPGRGIARVVLPVDDEAASANLASILGTAYDGTRIFERLPAALWTLLAPPALRGRIEQGIKTAFDPRHVLNPGILGELS